jgi:ATP-GRASP peptide maturase of grasp-with-spasm system
MILIIAESNDITTSLVMEWLLADGREVLRVNECDRITDFNINEKEAILQIRKLDGSTALIDMQQVSANWFRKGGLNFKQWLEQEMDKGDIDKYITAEIQIVADFMHYHLYKNRHLGSFFNSRLNKWLVNALANDVGLKTPAYIISSSRTRLQEFVKKYPDAVTKAIAETVCIQTADSFIIGYTEPVNHDDLALYPETLAPTLLQQKILKKYELRIFYLDGVCYSAAIFSQNDDQTKVDFRKYNWAKPNRTVPYTLPAAIAEKIHLLMGKLRLNTGSIDMLVDETGEYIFLEVNPVGQFGMVSHPCNYYLEKKVARFLSQNN